MALLPYELKALGGAPLKQQQGELQGATASLNAFSMIFAPLLMPQPLHVFATDAAPVYFPGAAAAVASCGTSE